MHQKLKILVSYLNFPLLLLYLLTNQKELIRQDLKRWFYIQYKKQITASSLLRLLSQPVFRSVFYHRIKCGNASADFFARILSIVFIPERTLIIYTRDIGGGLFIQHGVSTIIAAKKIGKNVWINQQVTIGYTNDNDCPTIGDNVTIKAGAIIVGKITVGDNTKVGAKALVINNIPDNCTVFSEPSRYFPSVG